ncbi:NAD(P)(+) transhydrogenase (Re/Si-specific) subunit beta [Flavitalea sp. BT771]|uniref:NAD(P)(+) transhydrogenase (Re/Si-specific) subunit beta n=1 Tax=Flavitalea sp. BT771 TaxID=3063329 RepID=UPI0026E226CB|nr:NAD(P)(+) transhydrogenase (Re/Si-specific) subunit beta [Flavitalea sp. BT771]MDO6429846.1 NAD(P)(+) transhydrogenase (Re/Si-specific) subunit beta [Flavitalea sp. BT771]MDV6218026.1 NAD(P)(+) transhydrogenase (Re/Si-specific) subunit beta [Flavitalea sp. BT771]
MGISLLTVCYLVASVTFILGLKMLSDPATARRGNLIAAGGMILAIVGTIFLYEANGERLHNYGWIFGGIFIGGIAGALAARKVQMTAMPEMVSLFNGTGGACAALISIAEFRRLRRWPDIDIEALKSYLPKLGEFVQDQFKIQLGPSGGELLIILLGLIIGSVSFAGSIIAWGKLNGRIKDVTFRGQHIFNLLLLSVVLLLAGYILFSMDRGGGNIDISDLTVSMNKPVPAHVHVLFYIVLLLSVLYGVCFVLPIGGADMPVVISLLNSFTGVAAACGGFLYNNKAMLTGGILVGAAGTLLTILMCKAMNRSLKNVLIRSFGSMAAAAGSEAKEQGAYKEISLSDAAVILSYAHKVMIVPGYGLAVAQAQHACHELEKLLTEKGVEVKYAIHPVAGRMPGHMNVLLAEADVSYDNLLEMEQANEQFPTTDVVIVLGANDVVNPAAKSDPASPIYGMPILEVELARTCIVNKRSMKPGYAGIDNELFFRPKTSMLFGDAKKVLQDLLSEIKSI